GRRPARQGAGQGAHPGCAGRGGGAAHAGRAGRRTTAADRHHPRPRRGGVAGRRGGDGAVTYTWPEGFRAGFASLVGRPNAGKSTLTNALVGQKVAITSGRPQTTRHVIRGVVHRPDAQLVLVDTPGLHRPRTLLGERLNDLVLDTLAEVDVVAFCVPADQRIGPGDRFIAEKVAQLGSADARTPVVAVATKADLVGRARLAEHLVALADLGDWADVVPVSAVD